MESTTVDSMCRCCAAEGLFKDIKTSYHWMGEEEVYGDMLRECFDVKLAMIEQGGICEVCITQLRNATNFKKQVQHTEKKFKRQLDSGRFKATEVKEEVSGEERAHSSDENDQDVDNDNVDDEDYMPDFEIPIKTESPEEKSRKRGAKASTSRAKRSRLADDADKSRVQERSAGTSSDPISELAPKLRKHRDFKQILICCNATPMCTSYGDLYMCAFCNNKYLRLDQLKRHTREDHEISTDKFLKKNRFTHGLMIDITSLACKLCCESFVRLELLVDHLNLVHKKRIELEYKSIFFQFKSDSETLQCIECSETFNSLKCLGKHIREHMKIYKCKLCELDFTTANALRDHKINEHITPNIAKITMKKKSCLPTCYDCGIIFPNRYTHKRHVKNVHMPKGRVHPCKACDRVFDSVYNLKIHTRRDHLLERNYRCDVCDKAFFNLTFLKRHLVTHSDEKKYSCNVCGKRFKMQKSLGPHMNIHNGVRRFKCDQCGQEFVQKASWKGHMRARHSVADA